MSADKFLRGAVILTVAGLLVKVLGSVNRILLSRLLGGEGIGLYQMGYPMYVLIQAVAYAGIPIAISIIVSEYAAKGDYANVRRVFRFSLGLMILTGLALALGFFAGAHWLLSSGMLQDQRAYYALLALTPAVFFCTVLASFRGFFQGQQLMQAPAAAQIMEQFVRVVTMLALAYLLLPAGLEYAAAGAAFGAVPGSIVGMFALCYFYRRYRHYWQGGALDASSPLSFGALFKRLVLLALPVSCANILIPVSASIDMLFVPRYLVESGFAVGEATTLYGYLAGMAQPLLLLATIPTNALATSLVPAVAEAYIKGERAAIQEKAAAAMKWCCLVTVPAAIGMSALAEPLSRLLYGTAAAGTAIFHTGPSLAFLGIQQVTAGMLQGTGHTALPMLHMLLGIAAKLIVLPLLVTAEYGVAGAAWATNICFALTALLNLVALSHYKITFTWYNIFKIILAASAMGIAAAMVEGFLALLAGHVPATLAALSVAVFVYAALVLLFGVLSKEELKALPLLRRFRKPVRKA